MKTKSCVFLRRVRSRFSLHIVGICISALGCDKWYRGRSIKGPPSLATKGDVSSIGEVRELCDQNDGGESILKFSLCWIF